MPNSLDFFAFIVLVLLAFLLVLLGSTASSGAEVPSESEFLRHADYSERTEVEVAIIKLQPWFDSTSIYRNRKLVDLAAAIEVASTRYGIHPMIAVSVAFRESSLLPSIRDSGCVGLFQVKRNGSAVEIFGSNCDLIEPECNALVAMSYMNYFRERCGSSPWLWIGAYGRGHCPRSIKVARSWSEVRVSRRLFCSLVEECDTIWEA